VGRAGVGVVFAAVLLLLSVVAVLRWSADQLAGDAILQSVMSVQDVRWFFWGQDRFASVVPALVSPIADPAANLFAGQLVNALAFYGLLLLVAAVAAPVLTDRRGWRPVLVIFLLFATAAAVILEPLALYFMALDAQPYALSWLLGLGSFLLWRQGAWWTAVLAGLLTWLAVGLNPSVVVGVAVLAVGQMVRSRQWIRWPAFGAVWLICLGSWMVIAARYPPIPGPTVDVEPDYYAFHLDLLRSGAARSLGALGDSLVTGPTVALAVIAAVSLVVVPARLRAALLIRIALLAGFAAGYWVLFTGNAWVAANGWGMRYYFPVLAIVVIGLAAPVAAALLAIRATDTVAVAVAATACAVGSIGPQTPLADAPVLVQVDPTAAYARSAGIHYVAGDYWYVWPVLHQMLVEGRDSAFATALRSDGDPTAYRRPFDQDLAAGRRPQAVCVNDSADACVTYLNHWTEPGGSTTPEGPCPAPPQPGNDGTCLVLEFTGPPVG
jgi:hypothetical protein